LLAALFLTLAGTAAAPQATAPEPLAGVTHLTGAETDYDHLIGDMGGARFVLLGEATHGTREFYEERARITLRLAREGRLGAVVLEADWADAERLDRYVRGEPGDATAEQALTVFGKFPRWMWRNAEFAAFLEQLRAHNLAQPPERRVGVYGMDLYGLFKSADAVVATLSATDPAAAERMRRHYRCFARHRPNPEAYEAAVRRPGGSCQRAAEAALAEIRARPVPADPAAREAWLSLQRNAAVVAGAEQYHRAQSIGVLPWNVRDRHMTDTVAALAEHIGGGTDPAPKLAIWAHNSHVGDARATEMKWRGELNIGQLMRERFGGHAYLVGFQTHGGTVIAASEWGQPGRLRTVSPARPESDAAFLRGLGLRRTLLLIRKAGAGGPLHQPRAQRAIGVIYHPEGELQSHYLQARLSDQFDALIYLDTTSAVRPLAR
jgi:erythromycin esterase-like protein